MSCEIIEGESKLEDPQDELQLDEDETSNVQMRDNFGKPVKIEISEVTDGNQTLTFLDLSIQLGCPNLGWVNKRTFRISNDPEKTKI